jgi:ubiquinone/menaquinone biosynthesis C-methylase UbiE
MDATDLKFLDETFSTATSFFTLMYMKPADQERAARELHRVIRPGGRLLVWDVLLPARFDPVQDIAVFPLDITFLGRTVSTGYGTFFPATAHDLDYYVGVLERAGFTIAARRTTERTFFLEARKAPSPGPTTP